MRCLSPSETEVLFEEEGFRVSLEHAWYRAELYLDPQKNRQQTRVAAVQPVEIAALPYFILALNAWLPTNRQRLFWGEHWEISASGRPEDALAAMVWNGLGETRSLAETPGLLLEAQDWAEFDPGEIKPDHAFASSLLAGLLAQVMITQSDAWLVSKGSHDMIEFWEGHFFFHSDDPSQIARGHALIDEYRCVRWKDSPGPKRGLIPDFKSTARRLLHR